jgi:hypothetical protein
MLAIISVTVLLVKCTSMVLLPAPELYIDFLMARASAQPQRFPNYALMEFQAITEKAFNDIHSRRLSFEESRRRELFTHQMRITNPPCPDRDPRIMQLRIAQYRDQLN